MKCPSCYSVNFDLIDFETYYCECCDSIYHSLELEKIQDLDYFEED